MDAARTRFLLLGFFLASVNGATLPDGRIIGGDEAQVAEFPWQVSLRANLGQHFCGGSLISSKKALTAAHCVNSRTAADVHVVTGATSLAAGGEYHAVTSIIYHENYLEGQQYSWQNDIAILTLATPAEISAVQSPIGISDTAIAGSTPAVTSGWGLFIYPSNSLPTTLQRFNLTILSNEDCQSYHTLTIHDSHICAISTVGEGVCSGDSGGPLVVGDEVVGVTSWVNPCGNGIPDVYTRVSSFYDWLVANTEDDDA